jgi:hypothetical protein
MNKKMAKASSRLKAGFKFKELTTNSNTNREGTVRGAWTMSLARSASLCSDSESRF